MENCNCVKEVEEKIKDNFIKNCSENDPRIKESSFERISWFPYNRLFSSYVITYSFTKKNGTPSSKNKNVHTNIFYTYCPFCGKKYKKFK